MEGAEEEVESEGRSVIERIGSMTYGESRPTYLRCDDVSRRDFNNDPEGI